MRTDAARLMLLAVLGAVSGVLGLAAAPAGARERVGIIDRCDPPSPRPHAIVIACGDGNFGLKRLRWRHWGRAVASARGRAYANDCEPSCAGGAFHAYDVTVRAGRIRPSRAGGVAYTRLRIRYTGARPAGAPRVLVQHAVEDAAGYGWR